VYIWKGESRVQISNRGPVCTLEIFQWCGEPCFVGAAILRGRLIWSVPNCPQDNSSARTTQKAPPVSIVVVKLLQLLINGLNNTVSNSNSIVVEACLRRCCIATAVFSLCVSKSLPSNGSTYHSINHQFPRYKFFTYGFPLWPKYSYFPGVLAYELMYVIYVHTTTRKTIRSYRKKWYSLQNPIKRSTAGRVSSIAAPVRSSIGI
jgi:hypothetical protein